jgi:hypothetical protein
MSGSSDRALSWGRVWGLGALVAGIALATVALFTQRLNTDVAWFLFLAERIGAGEVLYVDRVDINLPWIVHLSRVPTTVAGWFGVSEILVMRSLVLLAALVSVSTTVRLWTPISGTGPRAWMLAGSLWVLLLWMPGADIGQREHLLALGLVPYVSLRCRGQEARAGMAILIGLAAGIAIALKPHFVLIWVAIEVDRRLAGLRWIRPESVSVGLTLALSVVLLPVLHPEYFDVIRDYGALYSSFLHFSPWRLLLTERLTVLVIVVGALASSRDRELAIWMRGFLVAAVVTLVVGVGQRKGYTYHFYPAHGFAGIILLLLAFRNLPSDKRTFLGWLYVPALGAALWMFVLWGGSVHRWGQQSSFETVDSMANLLGQHADGGSVIIWNVRKSDVFPLVNVAEVKYASRYDTLWPLVSLYKGGGERVDEVFYRTVPDMGALERRFFEAAVDDLLSSNPTLLVVDEGYEPFLGGRFDYLDYFGQDSLASQQLSRYVAGARQGRLQLYHRVD